VVTHSADRCNEPSRPSNGASKLSASLASVLRHSSDTNRAHDGNALHHRKDDGRPRYQPLVRPIVVAQHAADAPEEAARSRWARHDRRGLGKVGRKEVVAEVDGFGWRGECEVWALRLGAGLPSCQDPPWSVLLQRRAFAHAAWSRSRASLD
jgi:hypothetical protein